MDNSPDIEKNMYNRTISELEKGNKMKASHIEKINKKNLNPNIYQNLQNRKPSNAKHRNPYKGKGIHNNHR